MGEFVDRDCDDERDSENDKVEHEDEYNRVRFFTQGVPRTPQTLQPVIFFC
jgi:hypothetical protein